MKLIITAATIAVSVLGAQLAEACSWAKPEPTTVVQELQTVALSAAQSNPLHIDVIIEPLMEYQVSEKNTTGMCPDEVYFSEQFAIRYTVDNGLNTVCNVIATVTKAVPWAANPTISYSIENLQNARCTR